MPVSVAVRKMISPGMDLHQRLGMILLLLYLILQVRRDQGHAHAVLLIQIISQQHISKAEFTVTLHGADPPCFFLIYLIIPQNSPFL